MESILFIVILLNITENENATIIVKLWLFYRNEIGMRIVIHNQEDTKIQYGGAHVTWAVTWSPLGTP